jgi:hypothetical protein
VPFLAAEAFDFGDGHAGDADLVERGTHVIELERFDNGGDKFHLLLSSGGGSDEARDSGAKLTANNRTKEEPKFAAPIFGA